MTRRRPITVAAGLIWGRDGRLLVSQRLPGAEHGGRWELPGGKVEPGESAAEALRREIREELGIEVEVGAEFNRVVHDYPARTVTLIGLHALHRAGRPRAIEVADFRWLRPEQLAGLEFPEANARLFDSDWREPPEKWT